LPIEKNFIDSFLSDTLTGHNFNFGKMGCRAGTPVWGHRPHTPTKFKFMGWRSISPRWLGYKREIFVDARYVGTQLCWYIRYIRKNILPQPGRSTDDQTGIMDKP